MTSMIIKVSKCKAFRYLKHPTKIQRIHLTAKNRFKLFTNELI